MTVQVRAGQTPGEYKADINKVKVVKQADGTEVLRLADLEPEQMPAVSPKASTPKEQSLSPWLESVLAPRLVTALATLPGMSRREGENLSQAVDPAMVRSWAEVMEPSLAMRWNAFAQVNGFAAALLQRPEEREKALQAGGVPVNPTFGAASWSKMAATTTWSNVVSEGAKRALSGQQALQEWLLLPMPEPKSNPWLSGIGSYRY